MKYQYKVIYDGHNPSLEADVHNKILDAYGDQGWELVSVVFGPETSRGPSTFIYYFKRPLV